MESIDGLSQAGGGLAFGLLVSSFLMMFYLIWLNQRKKRL
jgi:hypothetical protein